MSFKLNHILVTSALALGVLGAAGCQQPEVNCTVFHYPATGFAARYELESGDASSACGMLPGDVLGLNVYYADGGGRPALDDSSVAIRPQYVNSLIFYAAERGIADLSTDAGVQGVGDFTGSTPNDQDFCEVPSFSSATVSIPDVPEQLEVMDDPATEEDETVDYAPPQAATTITYEWSNMQVLVSAEAQGTQFAADLHFEQDGCAADYHVTALYPATPCTADADCQDSATGINPNYAVECDLGLTAPAQYYIGDPEFTGGLCVPSEEPPSYK